MQTLNIGGKDYTLEYSIEASLYKDCVESTLDIMQVYDNAQNAAKETNNRKENNERLKELFNSMANVPSLSLNMFYGSLIEHHGEDGDGTVLDIKDAKRLLKQYLIEHKEDETGSFFGVIGILIEVMTDDGFFTLIGLGEEKKQKKVPQDHKKKSTTTTKSKVTEK